MTFLKNMNDIDIDVQIVSNEKNIPTAQQFQQWIISALKDISHAEITLRVVDEDESARLNATFRHKEGPTNVLSFPMESPGLKNTLLGDIVICAPLAIREAQEQSKTEQAHYAHLVVHGILHLLGYDHVKEEDAQKMESLEIKILADLGFSNPYE